MGGGDFQALLIGVPRYEDPDIDDLPFIEDDLAELAGALRAVGYTVRTHDFGRTDRDHIDSAVEFFFQDARPGQTLLVYLSGHGIHNAGTDYLVPRGAAVRSRDFAGRCVSLDFADYVESSNAGDVVVFVDACREGVHMRQKSVGNTVSWSNMQVQRAGKRHYCHVYACSPGERAQYVADEQSGSFSLFSRALSTLVADQTAPGTLGGVQERLQKAVDELTGRHGRRPQQVRVRTETNLDDFVIVARPGAPVPPPNAVPGSALSGSLRFAGAAGAADTVRMVLDWHARLRTWHVAPKIPAGRLNRAERAFSLRSGEEVLGLWERKVRLVPTVECAVVTTWGVRIAADGKRFGASYEELDGCSFTLRVERWAHQHGNSASAWVTAEHGDSKLTFQPFRVDDADDLCTVLNRIRQAVTGSGEPGA